MKRKHRKQILVLVFKDSLETLQILTSDQMGHPVDGARQWSLPERRCLMGFSARHPSDPFFFGVVATVPEASVLYIVIYIMPDIYNIYIYIYMLYMLYF